MRDQRSAADVANEEARTKLARLNELNDLKNLLVDPRMRALVWRFMSWGKPFGEQFHPNSNVSAHNLGRRAGAMWWWNEISEADVESLIQMQREGLVAQADSDAAATAPPESDRE